MLSDVFLCSSNAVTIDGKLINIDAIDNRIAVMVFGPKKVIVVVGRNRMVRNVEEGMLRARNVAAVANCLRYNYNTPCTTLGYCIDCRSPERPCNVFIMIERRPTNIDVHAVLVNEDLSF